MRTIKVKRAYKTELAPNSFQRSALCQFAGAARFVWNWGLARRIEEYLTTGKSSNAIEQHRQLNALKKTHFPWLYQVSKCVPQEALRDLDRAFAAFYRRLELKRQGKYKGPLGFPRFKKKKDGRGSFRLTGCIRVKEDRIKLPRLGWIKLKEKGYIPTDRHILSATVSERAGRWFVSVLVEEEIAVEEAKGPPIGVDLGVNALATCSDGRVFERPKALQKYERKLKRLQRELSRRMKGGKNWEKTRQKIARLFYRVRNIRRDTLHKVTSAIVAKAKPPAERPSVVVIEDLDVAGMMKNHHLAGAIADASFHEFRRLLEYKAAWYGVKLVVADRYYPSSKRCSVCGNVNSQLSLSARTFVCPVCGYTANRDLNAALNLAILATTPSSGGSYACGDGKFPIVEAGTG